MKRCSRCGETKPLSDFNRKRRAKDGRQSWCRSCFKDYGKASRPRAEGLSAPYFGNARAATKYVRDRLGRRVTYRTICRWARKDERLGSGNTRPYTHGDVEGVVAAVRATEMISWKRPEVIRTVQRIAEEDCRSGWVVVNDSRVTFHEELTAGLFSPAAIAIPIHEECGLKRERTLSGEVRGKDLRRPDE